MIVDVKPAAEEVQNSNVFQGELLNTGVWNKP